MRLIYYFPLLFTFALYGQEKVILDTDPSFDPDDAGCIAMLHSMASQGECEILAMINSTNQKESALCISSINYFYNRQAIPVGDYKGYATKINATEQTYDFHIARDYPREIKTWEETLDGVKLYREILESAEDTSITVVIVGTMHNFYDLLRSQPDELSAKSGVQLVAEKVKLVATMGGSFLNDQGYDRTNWGGSEVLCSYTEWSCMNEERNRMCRYVIENCPAPFIASGWENGNGDYYNAQNGNVMSGQGLKSLPENHIIRKSYERHFEYRGGDEDISRHSNDQCALQFAIRGPEDNYQVFDQGSISLDEYGACVWTSAVNRKQGHIQKARDDELIAREIEALMMGDVPAFDRTPPEAPGHVRLVREKGQNLLRWLPAADEDHGSWVVAYHIEKDGTFLRRAYGTRLLLSEDHRGEYAIRSINASGTMSAPVVFSTQ